METKSINSLSLDYPDITKSALISVDRNLRGIVAGSDADVRTPQFKDIDADEILRGFRDSVLFRGDDIVPELWQIEEDSLSKFGPRSRSKPWSDRKESTYGYYNYDWVSNIQVPASVRKLIGTHRLAPWSLENAGTSLPSSTSSGLPLMVKKRDALESAIRVVKSGAYSIHPAVLFTRTQEAYKTRDVWGIGIYQVLFESMFYRPLLHVAQKWPWRSALVGPDTVDKSITALMDRARSVNALLVSIDFSKYDQSVGPALQQAAFDTFSELFQPQYRSDIQVIADRLRTVPLITPDGVIYGDHGVPSGSAFTNELDSMVQLIIAGGYDEATTNPFQIQGDDGAYAVRDPERLFRVFTEAGLSVNEGKSVTSPVHMVYLQRFYHPNYRRSNGVVGGVYPVSRALNRLVHMERWTNLEQFELSGDSYFAIRAITILENCKHHPRFESLVRWTVKHDRNGLNFRNEDLLKYVRMIDSRGDRNISNQYSDMIRGLNSFDTVKLIKGM